MADFIEKGSTVGPIFDVRVRLLNLFWKISMYPLPGRNKRPRTNIKVGTFTSEYAND